MSFVIINTTLLQVALSIIYCLRVHLNLTLMQSDAIPEWLYLPLTEKLCKEGSLSLLSSQSPQTRHLSITSLLYPLSTLIHMYALSKHLVTILSPLVAI